MKTQHIKLLVLATFCISMSFCTNHTKNNKAANKPKEAEVQSDKNKPETILNVMTFNIRFGNDGANNWEFRKEIAGKVFGDYDIDVAGLQEVVAVSRKDLVNMLTDYEIWGSPTGDSQKYGGVWSPVMYNKKKFDKVEAGNFWLSETPEVESRGWDARDKRIVSWVRLKSKQTGSEFYFFNTHFDHKGVEARLQSAKLLSKKIAEITGGLTTIVSGDFNFDKTLHAEPYKVMVSANNKQAMKDTRYNAEQAYTGPNSSFNGFGKPQDVVIDYLFVSSDVHTYTYDILRIKKGEIYISDHYPIMCKIGFN